MGEGEPAYHFELSSGLAGALPRRWRRRRQG
jgi:hypothetical protein